MPSPRPIRVVNVLARLNVGGPAIHVSLLTQRMAPPDYESFLVTGTVGGAEGDMTWYATERGVTPIIIPTLGRELHPIRDIATLWKLYRLLRQLKPDVVATHTAKAGFVGRVAAWLAGAPVIVHTYHGHVFHGYFSPAKTRLFLLLERFAARLSDAIIALTPGQRDDLVNVYHIAPASKFIVMGYGLDLSAFAAVFAADASLDTQDKIAARIAEAREINALCKLAGFPEEAAGLIKAKANIPDARAKLLAKLSDSDEIDTAPRLKREPQNQGAQPAAVGTSSIWAARRKQQPGA